ncbi:MAG TPA: hypothetical protein VH309_02605 [Elusimicrobiota bacterium]|jgi:hypothetical protein|nr:hypothetical protein [Elusimicrobiota bacterium]
MKPAPAVRAVLLAVLAVRAAAGGEIATIPEIGPHYRILIVEKSIHPQNVLVAYTRLDKDCRVLRDPKRADRPAFDFYWLMDGSRYKPVNRLILRGIRKRLQVEEAGSAREFSVRLNDLKEVRTDLGASPVLRVRAFRTAAGCEAEGLMRLGPSNKDALIRLEKIDSEAALTGPFSAKVKLVALTGVNVKTGRKVVRVYRAEN